VPHIFQFRELRGLNWMRKEATEIAVARVMRGKEISMRKK